MSIISSSEEIYNDLIGTPCLYCGEPIHPPAVMCMGYGEGETEEDLVFGMMYPTKEIVLHAPCVLELFVRLCKDIWTIEKSTGRKVACSPLFDLRTRLVAEEMGG